MAIDAALVQAVRDRNVLLFVGSGVSATLGLPTFSRLIAQLATELGYDPDVFMRLGDAPQLAEFYRIKKGSLGDIRSSLDRAWHSGIDIAKSEVHTLLVNLKFPFIYTTNWDRWLERAFDHHGVPYSRIVNVADLTRTTPSAPQIVKFHGDFSDDDSIVLTEYSYFERLSFDTFLDIKFRADAMGRSLLFLGYSLTDVNLRLMIYNLTKLWNETDYKDLRPRSFIFLTKPNEVQSAVLAGRGITAISSEESDPTRGLLAFLRELHEATR